MKLRVRFNNKQIAKFIEDAMEELGLKKSDSIEELLGELREDDGEEEDE